MADMKRKAESTAEKTPGVVRFVAFTDHHGSVQSARKVVGLAQERRAEFLVCGGDFSEELKNWEPSWEVLHRSGLPIYFVGGNHEVPVFCSEIERHYPACHYLGWVCLQAGAFQIAGLDGLTGLCPEGKEDEKLFESLLRAIIKGRNANYPLLLVTHYPPPNTACSGPAIRKHGKIRIVDPDSGPVEGSENVRKIISILEPDLILTGHYHERFGSEGKIGGVRIVNPGPDGMVIAFPTTIGG